MSTEGRVHCVPSLWSPPFCRSWMRSSRMHPRASSAAAGTRLGGALSRTLGTSRCSCQSVSTWLQDDLRSSPSTEKLTFGVSIRLLSPIEKSVGISSEVLWYSTKSKSSWPACARIKPLPAVLLHFRMQYASPSSNTTTRATSLTKALMHDFSSGLGDRALCHCTSSAVGDGAPCRAASARRQCSGLSSVIGGEDDVDAILMSPGIFGIRLYGGGFSYE